MAPWSGVHSAAHARTSRHFHCLLLPLLHASLVISGHQLAQAGQQLIQCQQVASIWLQGGCICAAGGSRLAIDGCACCLCSLGCFPLLPRLLALQVPAQTSVGTKQSTNMNRNERS